MTINDHSEEFLDNVLMTLAENMLEAAVTLQEVVKDNVSTNYPPASKIGEYPHRRTWNGYNSLVVTPDTPREIIRRGYVRIGFLDRAWYMMDLELNRGRLGLLSTYYYMRIQLWEIILSRGVGNEYELTPLGNAV